METLGNELVAKNGTKVAPKYYCEKCDYTCCKVYNWKKHLDTSKHTQEIIGTNLVAKSSAKVAQNYCCEKCEKTFHTKAGLWKHNKKCKNTYINEANVSENDIVEPTDKELMMMVVQQNAMLIKENSEFKNIMMEVIKNGTHNTTHTNSHNKTFNLQFFLNETCKDAMNIMDFVDSLKLCTIIFEIPST